MHCRHWLTILCTLVLVWVMTFPTPGVAAVFAQTTCGGWRVISSPSPGSGANDLYSVSAASSNDIWAVGDYSPPGNGIQTLIEHWNGTQWSVIPSPNAGEGNYLYSVSARSSSDAWAVGIHDAYTLIEQWNGTRWSIIPSPNPDQTDDYLYSVSAVSSSDVWAVGDSSPSNGGTYTLIEHWDGTRWSVIPSRNPSPDVNYLYSVSAVSSSDVWAVGYGAFANGSGSYNLIEHWNGSQWHRVTSPSPGAFANILYGVAALSSRNAWTVGEYLPTPSTAYTLTEHWNGRQWKVVSSPSPGPSHLLRNATEVPGTSQAWAVGVYSNGSENQTLVEAYC
ncbi:MAG: hypothetical protein ACYDER_24215 [Ktedonobacteraceae bacterium]